MSLKPEEAKLCREYMKTWLIEEIRIKQEVVTKEKYKEYEPHILAYLLKHLKQLTK
tara:strand:+ start:63 stop:230 length:168 start_codon:yes stop_codon:yes gene_type:complete